MKKEKKEEVWKLTEKGMALLSYHPMKLIRQPIAKGKSRAMIRSGGESQSIQSKG